MSQFRRKGAKNISLKLVAKSSYKDNVVRKIQDWALERALPLSAASSGDAIESSQL